MFKEFKEFTLRGNMVDMAVGLMMGAAFGGLVQSLIKDLVMPLVGLALGGADFGNRYAVLHEGTPAGPYATLAAAQAGGAVTMNYGIFLNTVLNLLTISFALFIVVRAINRLHRAAAPTTRACPQCLSTIPVAAKRCPFCTEAVTA